MKNVSFKIEMTLTWSKAMAALIVIIGFILDIGSETKSAVSMIAIPAAAALLAGKQFNDRKKEETQNQPIKEETE